MQMRATNGKKPIDRMIKTNIVIAYVQSKVINDSAVTKKEINANISRSQCLNFRRLFGFETV